MSRNPLSTKVTEFKSLKNRNHMCTITCRIFAKKQKSIQTTRVPADQVRNIKSVAVSKEKELSQFFTPVWAAEILFNEHFSHLTEKDTVWEPSCGPGNCLSVVPPHIQAIGTDIDPVLSEQAKINTNRKVYTGDFRTVMFEELQSVTAMFGNPPFKLNVFEQFMDRSSNILRIGNKAGFIIPAYFFQTSRTFMRFARKWYIKQEIIPRDLFKGEGLLSKPLIWASFIREDSPKIVGFRLHAELCDINALKEEIKEIVSTSKSGSVWKTAVIHVVKENGGTATLSDIYKAIEGKRPTSNPFWKEQVRKVVQSGSFERTEESTYKLVA